jgi:hypothetical protein
MRWFNINVNYALGLTGRHLQPNAGKTLGIFMHEQVSEIASAAGAVGGLFTARVKKRSSIRLFCCAAMDRAAVEITPDRGFYDGFVI